jgi:hypothetical protein
VNEVFGSIDLQTIWVSQQKAIPVVSGLRLLP